MTQRNAVETLSFPPGFLWGAGTSSHQVEGGNRWNDWWEYEQSGRLPFASADACRHYERYEEDFDLARSLGHNCHRFSVEWSRIEPVEGQWDGDAVAHYAAVIRALRARNLEPVVTLLHFTVPAWFQRRGGWEAKDSPILFERFVARFLERLGEPVGFWLTINEPTVLVQQAFINGAWPPRKQRSWVAAARVMRNLARAHVLARQTLKRMQPGARVGFAHNAVAVEPCDHGSAADRICASVRNFALNRLFLRLVGVDPSPSEIIHGNLDFLGLNYYTRCCVASGGPGPAGLIGRACRLDHHRDAGIRSAIGWEVYPQGLAHVLDEFSVYRLPLFITENGIATDDDQLRCAFIVRHLEVLARAIARGRNVLGYLHWSLIDNFEWDMGTGPRFGLAGVDYTTQVRKPRTSAHVFGEICRRNAVSPV